MVITHLRPEEEHLILQVATMLVEAFKPHDPWPTLDLALEEVRESFGKERISRVAVDEEGNGVGWIGGISQYDGNVWELHPLVVEPERQGQGIGRALVQDLEEQVRQRKGITIYLGADDINNRTSLSGVDLYPNVWEHFSRIENHNRHQYEFYQKLGFVIVGVIPDANGWGKPDIMMSKRVGVVMK